MPFDVEELPAASCQLRACQLRAAETRGTLRAAKTIFKTSSKAPYASWPVEIATKR